MNNEELIQEIERLAVLLEKRKRDMKKYSRRVLILLSANLLIMILTILSNILTTSL